MSIRPYDKNQINQNQIISGIGKLFGTVEFQVLDVEEVTEIGNHHLPKKYSKNCFRQKSLMDLKLLEQRMGKMEYFTKSQSISPEDTYSWQEKVSSSQKTKED